MIKTLEAELKLIAEKKRLVAELMKALEDEEKFTLETIEKIKKNNVE
jgi:hypothetical protein